MYKLIYPSSFTFDAPVVQLIDVHRRGVDQAWMRKRAAVLTKELADIRPQPGKAYVHMLALGDGEAYGENRNGDYFSKKANVDRHHTFVKYGHLYLHHRNHDPKLAVGHIKYSAHNDKMYRVELVVEADLEKCAEYVEKVANEDLDSMAGVSMSCRVEHDVCSICGNKARSRKEYCKHASTMLCQTLADGRKVYVDNPNPTFFDISWVHRPADRVAYALRKVAAAEQTVGGAELAELAGVDEPAYSRGVLPPTVRSMEKVAKYNLLNKLAAMEKIIDGAVKGIDFNGPGGTLVKLRGAFEPSINCATDEEIDKLSKVKDLRKLLGGLAQARISLPLPDFLKLLLGKDYDDIDLADVSARLPGIFNRITDDAADVCGDGAYDPIGGLNGLPTEVRDTIFNLIPRQSVAVGPVRKRVTVIIARKIPEPDLITDDGISTFKSAAHARADLLAAEYAKYKLGLLTKLAAEGVDAVDLVALQNYVKYAASN